MTKKNVYRPSKNIYAKSKAVQEYRMKEARKKSLKYFYNSIPENLRGYDVEELAAHGSDYENLTTAGKASLRRYIEDPTLFLLLSGASGVGKSSVACAIALALLRRGFGMTAKYADVSTMLNEFSFGDAEGTHRMRHLSSLKNYDILILDDVGAGSNLSTPTRQNAMQSLISYRWEHDKITIMTTNLAISRSSEKENGEDSIQGWFGESAWDRIAGRASTGDTNLTRVNFIGSTLRGNSSRGAMRGGFNR